MISCPLNSGNACHRQAISPARFGLEKEVPLPRAGIPSVRATIAPAPNETRSGLICPEEFGPQLEKSAITPLESVAPTATTLSPSAGQPTYLVSSEAPPLLPALAVTIIPLATARLAARVIIVVCPF